MQKNLADKNPLILKIFRKKIRNMKFFIGDSLKIPDFAGILSSILSTAHELFPVILLTVNFAPRFPWKTNVCTRPCVGSV